MPLILTIKLNRDSGPDSRIALQNGSKPDVVHPSNS